MPVYLQKMNQTDVFFDSWDKIETGKESWRITVNEFHEISSKWLIFLTIFNRSGLNDAGL